MIQRTTFIPPLLVVDNTGAAVGALGEIIRILGWFGGDSCYASRIAASWWHDIAPLLATIDDSPAEQYFY